MNNELAIRFISHKRTIEIFVNGEVKITGNDPELGSMDNRIPYLIAKKDSLIGEMFQVLQASNIAFINRDQSPMEMKIVAAIRQVMDKCLAQKVNL